MYVVSFFDSLFANHDEESEKMNEHPLGNKRVVERASIITPLHENSV